MAAVSGAGACRRESAPQTGAGIREHTEKSMNNHPVMRGGGERRSWRYFLPLEASRTLPCLIAEDFGKGRTENKTRGRWGGRAGSLAKTHKNEIETTTERTGRETLTSTRVETHLP